MKKIFAIILAVLMLFSMSATAFATVSGERAEEYVMTVSTGTPKKVEDSINYRYPIYVTFTNESEGVYRLLEDFEFKFSWGFTKNAPEIVFTEATTHSSTVNENVYVESGESCKAYFYIEIPSDGKDVVFKVNIDGTVAGDYHFMDYVSFGAQTTPETTTAVPVETTTEAPTETTTVVTTTTTTAPTYVEDTEETGGDDYVEAPVEDEIPNTGSASVIGAVAALGLAAGAIILLKKKNK